MIRQPTIILFTIFATWLAMAGPLAAATGDPIGSATTVKNQVSAEFESENRSLAIGDSVYQNELIQVGTDSIGELVLNDDTMLALGPGSKMLLDKFVYNGEKKSGDVLLDIVRGTFRFITGVATKRSYRIRTPSAAITGRGTIFDVYAAPDDSIWLLLIEGGVRACSDRGDCEDLEKPGMIIRAKSDGTIEKPAHWASLSGKTFDFGTAFPFMVNAPNIDPSPLLTREQVEKAKAPTKSTPKKKSYKKKTNTKPKKTYKKKTTKKVYKKKAKKKYYPKKKKKASAGNSVVPAIVGIGVGLAIGKALKKKKKHRPHPKPCRGHKCY